MAVDLPSPTRVEAGAQYVVILNARDEDWHLDIPTDIAREAWLNALSAVDQLGFRLVEDCEPDYLPGQLRFWLNPKE